MEIKRFYNILVFGSVFAIFYSCQSPKIHKEAPEINELVKNEKFVIILPEDHRQGATWKLQSGTETAVVERLSDVWHGNEKGIYFNLRALSVGETTLHFIKRMHTDTIDTKHFIIKVVDR